MFFVPSFFGSEHSLPIEYNSSILDVVEETGLHRDVGL